MFDLPYAKMGAVPHKDSELIKKEVYSFTLATDISLRVELYYNDADATHSVVGADSAVVYASTNISSTYGNPIQTLKASQTDSELTFFGFNSTTQQIDNPNLVFNRGASGTATMTCINTGGICNTRVKTFL